MRVRWGWVIFLLILGLSACAYYHYVHLKDGTALRATTVDYDSTRKEYIITTGTSERKQRIGEDRVSHVSDRGEGDIILERLDDQVSGEDLSRIAYGLSQELIKSPYLEREKPATIAFLHVENKTAQYFNTDIITDKMMELLLNSGKAIFVAPEKRKLLLEEIKFQLSGITERSAELGMMYGVDFFIYGDISSIEKKSETVWETKYLSYYRLSLKMIEVKTSKIIWMGTKDWYAEKGRGFLE